MQMDWTTFILEVINFLVLVWILKRFFYHPVLAVLDARQQRVKSEMEKADKMREEAQALKGQYEARLSDWNREKEESRLRLEEELNKARAAGMENLKKILADEESKTKVRQEALALSREEALKRQARSEAFGASGAMLKRMASSDLTHHIAQVFQEDLAAMSGTELTALRNAAKALGEDDSIEVTSAHSLDEPTKAAVTAALSKAADCPLKPVFNENPELIAGLRAAVGECLLRANLADELEFFKRQKNNV